MEDDYSKNNNAGNGPDNGENSENGTGGDTNSPGNGNYSWNSGEYHGTGTNGDAGGSKNDGYGPHAPNGPDNGQYSQYGGNVQYKWHYDDYEKALTKDKKEKKRKNLFANRGFKIFVISAGSVIAAAIVVLAGFGIYGFVSGKNPAVAKSSQSAKSGKSESMNVASQPKSSGNSLTYQQVASKVLPSVVGVCSYNMQSTSPSSEGSGIIMSSDGYIVTNQHVIAKAKKIQIVTNDNKTYSNVKIVGSDTKTDIAVLKVDTKGFNSAVFGDSNQLSVGQEVIAIGNPGGLELAGTVTNGIVSALNRTMTTESGSAMKYIQTNALINPGNSGGPLVNMYGQVVGINSAKISEEGYEGIGFSIPISTAKPIVDSIIKNGYVTGRVKLGISVTPFSASQGKFFDIPAGLEVYSVEKNSDAAKKGLKQDDIITAIDGVQIASDDESAIYSNFQKQEAKHKAGDTIMLTVYRYKDGQVAHFNIAVKLEEDKGNDDTSSDTNQNGGSQYGNGGNQYGNGGSQNGNGGSQNGNGGSQYGNSGNNDNDNNNDDQDNGEDFFSQFFGK